MLTRDNQGNLKSITPTEYKQTLKDELPPQGILKTLPIIRHCRWVYNIIMFELHIRKCQAMGLGIFPSEHDTIYLELIWEGYA